MSKSGWVLRATANLNQVGSWSGRIHLHKLLYLADRLAGIKQPFEFKIYHYGPYSFDLDESVRELTASSLLECETVNPAYGPRYSPSDDFEDVLKVADLDLSDEDRARLSEVAELIGSRKSSALELIATCIWAMEDESISTDTDVVARVHHLKPRYSPEIIAQHLSEAKELKESCNNL